MTEIDIHCHIFNVRDVPAYAIIEDALISNPVLRVLASPAVTLAVLGAQLAAPSYSEEKAVLGALAAGRPIRGLPGQPRPSNENIFADGWVRFIRQNTSFGSAARGSDTLENDEFVRLLYTLYLPGENPESMTPSTADQDLTGIAFRLYRRLAAALANAGTGVVDYLAQFLSYFAGRVADYRYKLAEEVSGLLPTTAARLVTPATLDVGNWLEDSNVGPAPTPQAQQSELMALISLHAYDASRPPSPPSLVHGFIAFDPWQYVDDVSNKRSPNALDVVCTALDRDGFVGVKLYPPMGFRATCNTGRPDKEFLPRLTRDHPNLGQALDCALDTLYAYCIDNDVPIMAHCAASVGASTDNEKCADPLYWRQVLLKSQFKNLRLNLGHFGGIWDYDQPLIPLSAAADVGWTAYIGKMIQEGFPNLYADFGDFATILARTPAECQDLEHVLLNLRHLVTCCPKIQGHLMYGTDWVMLGIEPGFDTFHNRMRAQLPAVLGMSPDDFFWKNAARYLGLRGKDRTRARLHDFYVRHRRDPAVLDSFVP